MEKKDTFDVHSTVGGIAIRSRSRVEGEGRELTETPVGARGTNQEPSASPFNQRKENKPQRTSSGYWLLSKRRGIGHVRKEGRGSAQGRSRNREGEKGSHFSASVERREEPRNELLTRGFVLDRGNHRDQNTRTYLGDDARHSSLRPSEARAAKVCLKSREKKKGLGNL